MHLADFKHGAPSYGKYLVYPDNMKVQAFWIKVPRSAKFVM
jgi:hypothetical protein